jgi:predicted CXXCH cytochrome family protein
MVIMKILSFILLIMLSFSLHTNPQSKDECYNCHEALGDRPSELFKNDIHFKKGISCASCHGGNSASDDMDAAMNKNAGFIGIPKGDVISERCSACHSNDETMKKYGSTLLVNQVENLSKSVHGKLSITGKEKIVQCITCHNAHGIVPVKNINSPVHPLNVPKTCSKCHSSAVYMRNYNPSLPVDQLEKYRTSEHGIRNLKGDSKTAECASCHGSHDILSAKDVNSKVYPINLPLTCSNCHSNADYMKQYKIATDQFEKFSVSVHGVALLEKHDLNAPACNNCHGNHGAVPPGVESISKVCGSCHALNADLFSASPHKKAFDENNYPECETCHGNHEIVTATNKLLGVTKEAVCSKCHEEDKNIKGYEVAKRMRLLIDSLDVEQKLALSLINEAEQKGMEVSEPKFKLRDAHQAKLEARTMVHSFNQEKFEEIVIGKGLSVTDYVIAEARSIIDEFYFRRIGLGISVLVISFLAVVLFFYIRKIERNK